MYLVNTLLKEYTNNIVQEVERRPGDNDKERRWWRLVSWLDLDVYKQTQKYISSLYLWEITISLAYRTINQVHILLHL